MRRKAKNALTIDQFLSDFIELMEFSDPSEMASAAAAITGWYCRATLFYSDGGVYRAFREDPQLAIAENQHVLVKPGSPSDAHISQCLENSEVILFVDCSSPVIYRVRKCCKAFQGWTVIILTCKDF